MDKLVFIKSNTPFTNSKIIAECAGIQHHAIQQLIDTYKNDFEEFGKLKVAFQMRASKTNQKEKIYLLNKDQSTLLLTYSKNTEKIRTFKKELVKQFSKMEKHLSEMKTPEWQQMRLTAKSSTNTLHDDIHDKFLPYAIENGSKTYAHSPAIAYTHFEKPINKALGISKQSRPFLNLQEQNLLDIMNKSCSYIINKEVAQETDYHDIVKISKSKINKIADIFFE